MSKLLNDQRECAKQVNSLMEIYADRRHGPTFEREVDFIKRAYVFGHYDSRGGAGLVRAANVKDAMEMYIKAGGWGDPETGEPTNHDWDNAYEDLQGQGIYEMVVCDELIGTKGELLASYADDGYKTARLERRRVDNTPSPFGPPTWHALQVVLLWKGEDPERDDEPGDGEEDATYMADAPKIVSVNDGVLKYEYRLVRWEPGEDACGLVNCNLEVDPIEEE